MTPDQLFENLIEKISQSGHITDIDKVRKAYEYAKVAHEGQKRRDGSDYITHCIAAADICVDMGLDEDSIVAALLHDVIEDTDVTYDDVKKKFGVAIADIVDGVTKLSRVQYTSKEDEQMENLRKMLMAMVNDIRVIMVKIADRLHNMRTMDYQTEEKQRSKSLETMEIYAPLAHRLGMQRAKWELEDLSLRYLDPQGYNDIMSSLDVRMSQLEAFMTNIDTKINHRLQNESMQATVQSRIKHVYSIYRKMYTQKLDMSNIYDLCAFRIIVDTIPQCYDVLGIIHDMFKPVPGRFKDYISTPKPNMYQSIHTTVIGSEGIPFEVQIRTWDMHHTAEYGIAAHWKYKLGANSKVADGEESDFAWIRKLLEAQQEADASDFFSSFKIDMFSDDVFVFSPKGDVINLPYGATPIDFAYAIHSDVGNNMVGASVNGRIVTYDYKLQNGDIVEIRTSSSAPGPSRDWLLIARSGSSRTKIKQWFKRECRDENILRGRAALDSELKVLGVSLDEAYSDQVLTAVLKRNSFSALDDMLAAIGYGGLGAAKIAKKLQDEIKASGSDKQTVLDKLNKAAERREQQDKTPRKIFNGVLVEGLDNCLVKFSRCCTPVPGDDIVGFITRGSGVSIHRKDCENYLKSKNEIDNEGRWVNVSWANKISESYICIISIYANDRNGLVMDAATILNSLSAKVRTLSARDLSGGKAVIHITLEVRNSDDLKYIMTRLSSIPSVESVVRNGEIQQ